MSKMLHCLYAYPQTVNLNKKRNLFVRVELRKDDFDIRKPPLEVHTILQQDFFWFLHSSEFFL